MTMPQLYCEPSRMKIKIKVVPLSVTGCSCVSRYIDQGRYYEDPIWKAFYSPNKLHYVTVDIL